MEQIWRKDKFNFNHVDWTFGVNKFDVDHIQNLSKSDRDGEYM